MNTYRQLVLAGAVLAILGAHVVHAAPVPATTSSSDEITKYYRIETISLPGGVAGEMGGLTFTPDGRLVACFHSGEVYTYYPASGKWTRFAEGLHEPLGVACVNDREMLVMQRPELTRIRDTSGRGVADSYETVTDAFGLSGNYHEFAFGPAIDPDGNLFVSLNCGSAGAGIRNELRGEFKATSREGRMYACVPYRGWVMKIAPDGALTPWALGFRSPNGIGFDLHGNLFVTDNQGDWLGACKLYHVRKDHFYGHPASLVWKPGFVGEPLKVPVAELDAMRTRAAVEFPYATMSSSASQPLCDTTGGKFGPFAGQLLVGEMNLPRIMRVMLEEVDGELQGACVPFYDRAGLKMGNNRLAFGPDGSLWVGHDKRDKSWAGDKGIQHITWTGSMPMDVEAMHLTPTGFALRFTRPLDRTSAAKASAYAFNRYYYEYHPAYGSPKMDPAKVAVTAAKVAEDGRSVALTLADLKPGYLYELNLSDLKSTDGSSVVNTFLCYTLNHLAAARLPTDPAER